MSTLPSPPHAGGAPARSFARPSAPSSPSRPRPRRARAASSSRCSGRPAPARPPTLRMIAGFELPDAGMIELGRRRRRPACRRRARRQHRLPGLRALPAHERRARTSPTACGCKRRRASASVAKRVARGARRWCASPDVGARRPAPALRRPAPAGRARPGARQPPARAAARRAARRARPEAARADAGRAEGDPARASASPSSSSPTTRTRRSRMCDRVAVFNDGPHRAGRHARRDLRAPGQRVRRRLRRHLQPARCARGRPGRLHASARKRSRLRLRPTRGAARRASPRHRRAKSSISGSATRVTVDRDRRRPDARRAAAEPHDTIHRAGAASRGQRRAAVAWRPQDAVMPDAANRDDLEQTVMRACKDRTAAADGQSSQLVLARCGTVRQPYRRAQPPKDLPSQDRARARARLTHRWAVRWEGYDDKTVDWVKPFEQQTGCKVQRQVRRHLRRDGAR